MLLAFGPALLLHLLLLRLAGGMLCGRCLLALGSALLLHLLLL